MQANGAEMMRLAACLATERGIEVCAPVHDAFLICAPLDRLEADVTTVRECLAEASRVVLDGFELSTDAILVRHPDRYSDPRGAEMWDRVMKLIGKQAPGSGVTCLRIATPLTISQLCGSTRLIRSCGSRMHPPRRLPNGKSILSACRGHGSSGSGMPIMSVHGS